MFQKLVTILFLHLSIILTRATGKVNFSYNGFKSSNLVLDGIAEFTSGGLLKLTNSTKQQTGHAFYPDPVTFKKSNNGNLYSFSTNFVFALVSQYATLSGHGMAFIITPNRGLPGALPSHYLGLFNDTNNGKSSNHVLAVELDTMYSSGFGDINDNHVGIDINGLHSAAAAPASYFIDDNRKDYKNMSLISGKPMQVWIEYDGEVKQMNVTLAPVDGTKTKKPTIPLLTLSRDLSSVLEDSMYVGFSSATGSILTSPYVLGWSFAIDEPAESLDISQLPKIPRTGPKRVSKMLTIGLPAIIISLLSVILSTSYYYLKRKEKFSEELEDWESEYGPHRFAYKDLYIATKGFRDKGLLGSGGFGRVYKGILPGSKNEVAVKRVSHESRQGLREFVAEIVSLGRLRHRNIVHLLGYCRRKGELLLVYDHMSNGSLDRYLYNNPQRILNWYQRFRVIKGVASGLCYLHEEWEQVIVHRDIKASNVLLDGEMNGRLGDFGLARMYDHGTDPHTTHVVGTLGYLAPEHTWTGRATRSTDVFAFGAFLLEVACGRRPIDVKAEEAEGRVLVDLVFGCWNRGEILKVVDVNLGGEFVVEEVELVLKLGLLCSNVEPDDRPSIREVVQYLDGVVALPYLSGLRLGTDGIASRRHCNTRLVSRDGDGGSSSLNITITESFLSEGR